MLYRPTSAYPELKHRGGPASEYADGIYGGVVVTWAVERRPEELNCTPLIAFVDNADDPVARRKVRQMFTSEEVGPLLDLLLSIGGRGLSSVHAERTPIDTRNLPMAGVEPELFGTVLESETVPGLAVGSYYSLEGAEYLRPLETHEQARARKRTERTESAEWAGGCPTCHGTDGCLNIGRDHWYYCVEHRTKWLVGSNLFSGWREQTETEQREHYDELNFGAFTRVEPFHRD